LLLTTHRARPPDWRSGPGRSAASCGLRPWTSPRLRRRRRRAGWPAPWRPLPRAAIGRPAGCGKVWEPPSRSRPSARLRWSGAGDPAATGQPRGI